MENLHQFIVLALEIPEKNIPNFFKHLGVAVEGDGDAAVSDDPTQQTETQTTTTAS